MPKQISEIINGKKYKSLAAISNDTGISASTLYGRYYRGDRGNDLIRETENTASKNSKPTNLNVNVKIKGKTYTSINSIAKDLGISYNYVKKQYDLYPNKKDFEKNVLAFAKFRNATTKSVEPKASTNTQTPKTDPETPIRELRTPSIQKVGALSSLLISFIGEFTGYTINVNEFESAYDKGLDLSLDKLLEKSNKEANNQNIISKETLSKISKLEKENQDLQAKLESFEAQMSEQVSTIKKLQGITEELTTKKRRWWSK